MRVARGRGLDQRQPMRLALGHRQAVVVGPDAPREDMVAVDHEVMRGDRRAEILGVVNPRHYYN